MDDKITFRGSLSTGFRAPSLHHKFYTQKIAIFLPSRRTVVTGLINNVSSAARQTEYKKLDAEQSQILR
jgi:iron complex outermembrane receptor protein